nr:YicC/YloC family endoribonuclease [uncultured Devosia sp.]
MTQSLASMTGYARASGGVRGASFVCEVKTVNGRGLDIRLRLAPGLDALEGRIRQLITETLTRGSVTLNLNVQYETGSEDLVLNRKALETVLAAISELKGQVDAMPPSLDGILGLPGILEQRGERQGEWGEGPQLAVLSTVSQALVDLAVTRRQEGTQIAQVLLTRLDEVEKLVARAEAHPARSRDTILAKLRQQIADLSADTSLSEDRLAQEALLLATKADIREELDRLTAHIAAARQLIRNGGAVGRKLDFLAQEFNREANTLCSKSNAVDLTAIGLDLKAAIDQLREQVQNIE